MQIGPYTRKLLTFENLELSSWEPENQWFCDITNSQWIFIFFQLYPTKEHYSWNNPINDFLHNKQRLQLSKVQMYAWFLRNKFSFIIMNFHIEFKMAASTGKLQYLQQ